MCDLKRFETSLQKCQGRPLMDDLTQTYPRPGVRSDLSQKPLSIHAVCVCARCSYVCIHARYGPRARSAGAAEKQFLYDSITTAS